MFELLEELGKGGFATTYRARVVDPDLREEFGREIVALKIPLNKQKERVLRRELELNAGIHMRLRGLSSDHIVRYLGFVSFHDQITMVMEYMDQGSLRRLLGHADRPTPLPVRQAVAIAEGLLEGLSVIHREGILHRDIKPENVLMHAGIPKIADLGVSRLLDADELALSFAGTTPYMAPEILTSRGATFSADLWSLTITLYEMLTGRLPFSDGHPPLRTLINRICEQEAAPPSRLVPGIPPELDLIVAKGLHKDPEQRYGSAEDMRLALVAVQPRLAGEPIVVRSDADTIPAHPGGVATPSSGRSREQTPDPIETIEAHIPRALVDTARSSTLPALDRRERSAAALPSSTRASSRGIAIAGAILVVLGAAASFVTGSPFHRRQAEPPPAVPVTALPVTTTPSTASLSPAVDGQSARQERSNPPPTAADTPVRDRSAGTTRPASPSPPPTNPAPATRDAAVVMPMSVAGATTALQKGCESGDAQGCLALADAYSQGRGVTKDDARAATFYDRGCTAGLAAACYKLAVLYRDDRGVARNVVKAAALLQRSCDGGIQDGCTDLGLAYAAGRGVIKDEARAVNLYRKACDAQHGFGCSRLGFAYADGRGIAKDDRLAAANFQRACDLGFVNGCDWSGIKYLNGVGVPKDETRAVALFERACTGGDRGGCNDLGLTYQRGTGGLTVDVTKAAGLFQGACDNGNFVACVNLGALYVSTDSLQADIPRAAPLFQMACDGNYSRGCFMAGRAYSLAQGVARDETRATEFFRRACDGGGAQGCMALANRYRNGAAPLPRDDSQAVTFFQRACDLKLADACSELANAYQQGRGVARDAGRAADLGKRARELAGTDTSAASGIAEPAATTPPQRFTDWLTGPDYQTLWNQQTAGGFYPSRLDGRFDNGREEFKATWERLRPGCAFVSHRSMTKDVYDRENARYAGQGYAARVTTFVGQAGATKYQAVWTKGCAP